MGMENITDPMSIWEDTNNIEYEVRPRSAMQTQHCTSLQDTQKRLREILDANATLFHPDHVTASFSFDPSVQFTISRSVGELENETDTSETPEKKDISSSAGSDASLKGAKKTILA